jgi:hypothetical protein
MQLFLVGIIFFLSLVHTTKAEEFNHYFSLKYGTVKANGSSSNNHKFKTDNGSTKDLEFYWGSKYWVQLLGGVQLTPKNKVDSYLISFVLQSKDIFAVRTYRTNDELYKWDLTSGNMGTFGDIKARTTEYSYMWRKRADAYTHLTYGTSNYPVQVDTNKSGDKAHFSDPKPKIQYLYYGLDADPVRMALLDNVEIKNQPTAGDIYYLAMRFGFGVIKSQLSDTQYSNTYQNNTNQYGLANQKGTDLYMPVYFEGGFHASGNTSFGRAIGTIGGYYQLNNSLGPMIYSHNTSTTGYKWYVNTPILYGVQARLAVVF